MSCRGISKTEPTGARNTQKIQLVHIYCDTLEKPASVLCIVDDILHPKWRYCGLPYQAPIPQANSEQIGQIRL